MKKTGFIVGSAVALSLLAMGVALAATPGRENGRGWGPGGMRGTPPGVFGTVTALNGTTLTVASNGFGRNATSTPATAYTVNAANATVTKDGATSTIASVAVGDRVMVRGTVSGTSVTATAIMDGVPQGRGFPGDRGNATSTRPVSLVQGNGEPVIAGTVSAVNGGTLTVTNTSNITYTVDASTAKIVKGNATSTLASVAVDDNVIVQGTVNGTSVTAASVIDQGVPPGRGGAPGASANKGFLGDFFGGIGSFFKHLFGF